MRIFLPLLAVAVFAAPGAVRGFGGWYTPTPKYPAEMLATSTGGVGIIRFSVDEKGDITDAGMVRSTGSKFLDAYIVAFVKAHWKGPAGHPLSHLTEFDFRAPTGPKLTYKLPAPGYPPGPRGAYAGRSCTVVVAFNERGSAHKVAFVRSTGSAALDDHTREFIYANWRSSGGRIVARQIDISFDPSANKARQD